MKIRIKYLKFLIFIFLITTYSNISSKEITGNVIGKDGANLEFVQIKIKELQKQAQTNINGEFKFENIDESAYLFEFSRVGVIKLDTLLNTRTTNNFIIILDNEATKCDNIIITGTRTEKDIKSSPILTQVYSCSEIQSHSATNLSELLAASASMQLINSHGKGIQMQGLDPAYTAIMLDGNPLIGREGGTLDLDRINLSNIKRIEIIKGAVSSLYGSTALAGVINLISDEPQSILSTNTSIKYEQNNTFNVSSNVSSKLLDNKFKNSFGIDYSYCDGFTNNDLNLGLIVPISHNLTLQDNIKYNFNDGLIAGMFFRYNYLLQENSYTSIINGVSNKLDDKGSLDDLMYSASIEKSFEKIDFNIKYNYSDYKTKLQYFFADTDELESQDIFHQFLHKVELVSNIKYIKDINFTYGIGLEYEKVNADRIEMNSDNTRLLFSFLQADYNVNDDLNMILSARFDKHNDYQEKLSPKFAFSYSVFNDFYIKASVGAGFKAPSFQQLYMNWNNPQVGYSVFGSAYYDQGLKKLFDQGLIIPESITSQTVKKLMPESSISYNIGFNFNWEIIGVKANVFRNNLTDMIDVIPVAQKTNSQQVFTYFNLNKVHTQGIEADIDINLYDNLNLSLSYQYLSAIDDLVMDKIEKKEIFKNGTNGIFRAVTKSEYGGLFNRSPHSMSAKVEYRFETIGLNAILQGLYRSRYGYEDNNSNSILDDDSEYADAYTLWDIYLNYQLNDNVIIKGGIKNIFDYTNEKFLVYNVGFKAFISCAIKFSLL